MNQQPDNRGHFGEYGGRYVAETLMPALLELEKAYRAAMADAGFLAEFHGLLKDYVGRPSPLYLAERMTHAFGGAKIYLKRSLMRGITSSCMTIISSQAFCWAACCWRSVQALKPRRPAAARIKIGSRISDVFEAKIGERHRFLSFLCPF